MEYRLTFASDIDVDTANNLRTRIATILERPDLDALTILFSSEGGSTDQSMALFNFISQLPIPVQMHAMGHVGSAALPIFLAANRRTCAQHSRFLLHEYDWEFSEAQTLHRIDEATQRLRHDIVLAKRIIESRTKIPPDILKAISGEAAPVIIEPAQAKTFKIVDEVRDLSPTGEFVVWTA